MRLNLTVAREQYLFPILKEDFDLWMLGQVHVYANIKERSNHLNFPIA